MLSVKTSPRMIQKVSYVAVLDRTQHFFAVHLHKDSQGVHKKSNF